MCGFFGQRHQRSVSSETGIAPSQYSVQVGDGNKYIRHCKTIGVEVDGELPNGKILLHNA